MYYITKYNLSTYSAEHTFFVFLQKLAGYPYLVFRLGVPASVSHDHFQRPASISPKIRRIFSDFGAVRRPLWPTLQTGRHLGNDYYFVYARDRRWNKNQIVSYFHHNTLSFRCKSMTKFIIINVTNIQQPYIFLKHVFMFIRESEVNF